MLSRRDMIGLLAGVPVGLAPEAGPLASADGFGGQATMIVAGPEGGRVDRIATALTPLLARSLALRGSIRRRGTGGVDGVTAANQFAARAAPDGQTVLLVPGAAALAWLTGDTRAHFDTASWVPVMAGLSSGVLAGRLPGGGIGPGMRVRIAAELIAPELPALLAIELLGAAAVPVRGIQGDTAQSEALTQGEVDLVFVRERSVTERLAALQRAGVVPMFSMGTAVARDGLTRDPLVPDLPAFPEYFEGVRGVAPTGPLYEAWRAASASAQLEFALVLPQLTPPAMVAIWRQAAVAVADTAGWYPSKTLRVLAPAAATACIAATAAGAPAQLELRRWMAVRFDWRPV